MDSFVKALTDFKDHYGVIWFYVAGIITLSAAVWRLRNVFKNKPSLQIKAGMALENTDDLHGLLTVEVVNLGKKKAVVRGVSIQLENVDGSESHTLDLGKKFVELKEEGGIHIWQQVLKQRVGFLSYQEGADSFGYGEVYLTSGKKQRFDFMLLTDEDWKLIEKSRSERTVMAIGPTVAMDYKKAFDIFESVADKRQFWDKRNAVLKAIERFLNDAISNQHVSHQSLVQFIKETSDVKYIFQNDIQDFVKDLAAKGTQMELFGQQLGAPAYVNIDRPEIVARKQRVVSGFVEDLLGLNQRFARYLKITK